MCKPNKGKKIEMRDSYEKAVISHYGSFENLMTNSLYDYVHHDDKVSVAIEVMRLGDLEYVGNFKVSPETMRKKHYRKYFRCCGLVDLHLKINGRRYILSCDYGH